MPDYMFLLESRLSPEQRAVMMRVQELSAAHGIQSVPDGRHGARPDYRGVAARSGLHRGGKSVEDRARTGKGRREDSRRG